VDGQGEEAELVLRGMVYELGGCVHAARD